MAGPFGQDAEGMTGPAAPKKAGATTAKAFGLPFMQGDSVGAYYSPAPADREALGRRQPRLACEAWFCRSISLPAWLAARWPGDSPASTSLASTPATRSAHPWA